MEIVEAHFQLGHTSTLKKWRHSYTEIVMQLWNSINISIPPHFSSRDIPPLKKVEAVLYGNCGGIFLVRAYLNSKKVEAFLYGNCIVALKLY